MMETVNKTIDPDLLKIRRELHANPELSQHEHETAKKILQFLQENTNATVKNVGKTGVIAEFNASASGKTIMLRADTDALPIEEVNEFNYKSTIPGVSHKCGHDGHTTIMLGVAKKLTAYPIKKGRVILLWQPAEENGMGANEILQDAYFNNLEIDYVYALHNLPGYSLGQIILKKGFFTAHVKSLIVQLHGKTAHAAEPEHGNNPALAISEIIKYGENITNNQPEDDNFFLITPIYINMGSISHGISAGYGEIHLTIRSWSPQLFDKKCSALQKMINKTSSTYKLETEMSWTQEFYANENNAEAVDYLIKAAEIEHLDYQVKTEPFKWGEDFGIFTQKYTGAMFGLGAGVKTPALHNPDYDFPDEITATGINIFVRSINELLK